MAIGASFVGMKKNINGGHSLKTLSKEGQETFGKAIGQATRRLDVETKSLKAIGVYAAKDSLSVESYYKLQNHLEDAINQYRRPAMEIARQLIR
jgi:hypothetical protein